jgi:ATP-dependent Clp protease ATP-binding subunit ClpC
VSGVYPVVIEPRWASESERIRIAYHPSRQSESLVLREEMPLEEQLQAALLPRLGRARWDELGGLASRGKERLGRALVLTRASLRVPKICRRSRRRTTGEIP